MNETTTFYQRPVMTEQHRAAEEAENRMRGVQRPPPIDYGDQINAMSQTINIMQSETSAPITIADVEDLEETLDGKSNVDHTHIISGVTGLQSALDSKIASSQIGAVSGIAPLGSDQKVPSAYLPSYVDDVLEYANLAAFPGTGETSKIYTALDSGKIYRWSGSAYVEISASPGSTDAVPEGATNLYFTTARAKAAVVANSITDNVTDVAPSQEAVFEALKLKPIVYLGSTQKSNVKLFCKSVTTTGGTGTATFYLTDNGAAGGNALFTNVYDETIGLQVNDSTNSYCYSWSLSVDKKTLTATVTKQAPTTILGIPVLGGLNPTANGTAVNLTVWGD